MLGVELAKCSRIHYPVLSTIICNFNYNTNHTQIHYKRKQIFMSTVGFIHIYCHPKWRQKHPTSLTPKLFIIPYPQSGCYRIIDDEFTGQVFQTFWVHLQCLIVCNSPRCKVGCPLLMTSKIYVTNIPLNLGLADWLIRLEIIEFGFDSPLR